MTAPSKYAFTPTKSRGKMTWVNQMALPIYPPWVWAASVGSLHPHLVISLENTVYRQELDHSRANVDAAAALICKGCKTSCCCDEHFDNTYLLNHHEGKCLLECEEISHVLSSRKEYSSDIQTEPFYSAIWQTQTIDITLIVYPFSYIRIFISLYLCTEHVFNTAHL